MSRDSRLAASLPSLLALLLAGSSAPAQTSARESLPLGVVSPCPGDVNLDGDRGPGDLALLSAHLSGQRTLTGQALGNADCNLDSFVDMGDVVRLTEHNTGKAQLVPCGDLEPLEVACPGLSFEKASAAPLEVVGLGTLPKEFAEPILAIVTDENEEVGTISFVERLEDGSATFFTPFFPGVVTEGGAVKVQLTDWKLSCPLADFAIEAIPPAPGELSRLVDALQEVLDVNVAAAGLTPEGLIAGEGELSQQAVPLALAQIVLDSPDNPNSLRAVSEGTAPVFEGTAETGLLDAVVAYLGIVEALGPESSGPSVAGRPSASNCGRSAADLDQCMRAALSDPDVPEEAKQNIAVSIAAFRDSPHSNTPLDLRLESARAHSAITMALAAGRWTEVAATALLPSILLPLKFDLNPAVMEEDLEFGEWTAEVSAFSKGWKLDRERVLEEIKVHPSHRRFQESLNLLGSQIDQVPALDKLAEGIVDTILQRPE